MSCASPESLILYHAFAVQAGPSARAERAQWPCRSRRQLQTAYCLCAGCVHKLTPCCCSAAEAETSAEDCGGWL